jgi:hypothetical protein
MSNVKYEWKFDATIRTMIFTNPVHSPMISLGGGHCVKATLTTGILRLTLEPIQTEKPLPEAGRWDAKLEGLSTCLSGPLVFLFA